MSAYELLRCCIHEGAARARLIGLGILLREGLLAWVGWRVTCHETNNAAPKPTSHKTLRLVSNQIDTNMVRVLVNMAMADRKEHAA